MAGVADADITAGSATDLWGNQDTIIGVENVVGSSGDDLLLGSSEANSITGGAGDDQFMAVLARTCWRGLWRRYLHLPLSYNVSQEMI